MANPNIAATNQANRKKGDASLGAVYTRKLPMLSEADQKGLEVLIKGGSATEAWRAAHPDSQATGHSPWILASRWRRQKHIQDYLDAATQSCMAKIGDTLADHVHRLAALASEARRSGNYGAAAQCEIAIGRALGHYVERSEVHVMRGVRPEDVIRAIGRLLGPDAASKAALKLGVPRGAITNQSLISNMPDLIQADSVDDTCLNVEQSVDNSDK